jgi:hypothetical protein
MPVFVFIRNLKQLIFPGGHTFRPTYNSEGCEAPGSHGGEFEADNLLGYSAV